MMMCRLWAMAASACLVPADGIPVASITTSSPSAAISAMASSVRWVAPLLSAVGEGRGGELLGRPPGAAARLARPLHVQVGNPQDLHPRGEPRLGQEHGAELAGPDEADPDGELLFRPFEQHSVEIHRDVSSCNGGYYRIRLGAVDSAAAARRKRAIDSLETRNAWMKPKLAPYRLRRQGQSEWGAAAKNIDVSVFFSHLTRPPPVRGRDSGSRGRHPRARRARPQTGAEAPRSAVRDSPGRPGTAPLPGR